KAKDISKISILSRKPVKMADDAKDPRINVILHDDFGKYDSAVLSKLQGADGCVWALGISQTKVNKDDYVKITKDYTLHAAEAFATLSTADQPFRFVYVSGEGATQTPGRFSAIFARVKGETEQALADMTSSTPSLRADSVRPAYVDASEHEAVKPYIPDPGRLFKVLATGMSGIISAGFLSGSHSPTPMLGSFLTKMAMGRVPDDKLAASGAFQLNKSWVVPNVALRKVEGL
ncbi:hypothetical protein Golomagni_07683, partial [Golovinomyces magnicellulatus]